MLKTILQKAKDILMRPFREHFLFLVSFFVLATSPYFAWQLFVQGLFLNAIFQAIHCFVISYVVTLLIGLIKPEIVRKVIQGAILVISAILFAVNFYCIFELGYLLDADLATLILGSDPNEAKEFASVLLPKWMIPTVLAIYLIFTGLWALSKRRNLNLGKKTSWAAMGILCFSGLINAYTWEVWEEGPINRLYEMTQYEVTEDLKTHYTHPNITISDTTQLPTNVVLIIGESFARCHSSLYGYEKNTNPMLSALHDNSLLFAFDSINSPAPTTAESIRLMMGTYCKEDDTPSNDKKWFEYTTIIEIMEDCGFDCYWFGNQARGSKKNGASRVFAEACKRRWFLQHEGSDKFNVRPDMVLVDSSFHFINQLNPEGHHFIIYHMMGSHFDFSMRYPKEYGKFTEKDYLSEPENHRTILSTYDNSILYNDYVVSQIIDLYKETETVVIYLT